jgi:hypothetical protein
VSTRSTRRIKRKSFTQSKRMGPTIFSGLGRGGKRSSRRYGIVAFFPWGCGSSLLSGAGRLGCHSWKEAARKTRQSAKQSRLPGAQPRHFEVWCASPANTRGKVLLGARDRTRTGTSFRKSDFKSEASAISPPGRKRAASIILRESNASQTKPIRGISARESSSGVESERLCFSRDRLSHSGSGETVSRQICRQQR